MQDVRNLPQNLVKFGKVEIASEAIDRYNTRIEKLTETLIRAQSGQGPGAGNQEFINAIRERIDQYQVLIDKAREFRNESLGAAQGPLLTMTEGLEQPEPFSPPDLPIDDESMFQAGLEADRLALENFLTFSDEVALAWQQTWDSAFQTFSGGVGDAFANAIVDQESLGDALQSTMRAVAKQVISSLIQIGIQRAIQAAVGKGEMLASTAAGVASAGTLTAAYAPAALAANIASFGGAALAAASTAPIAASSQIAALASTKLSGIAHDGLDYVPQTGTYLLEKGERVVKKEDNQALMSGGMGNTYNFTIQALDTQSGIDFIMKNESAIVDMVQQRYDQRGESGGPMR